MNNTLFKEIYNTAPLISDLNSQVIGFSRQSLEICGYRFGSGSKKISLIAGCHADEPVGPLFLRKLVAFFQTQPANFELFKNFSWWIVPHVNPDGERRNAAWQVLENDSYDFRGYLEHVVRELPGDDIEFGFSKDSDTRPENLALMNWWEGSFDLHCSLHGMAYAGGPWFLIDENWKERAEPLISACSNLSEKLSYQLHDIQRNGEKGFFRIQKGFCTRPNSKAMKQFFLDKNDTKTASLFKPNSMEYMRAISDDALTLVTEMPLFILPEVGQVINPRDEQAKKWKAQLEIWKSKDQISNVELEQSSIKPMSVRDQMRLQWEFISTGAFISTGLKLF